MRISLNVFPHEIEFPIQLSEEDLSFISDIKFPRSGWREAWLSVREILPTRTGPVSGGERRLPVMTTNNSDYRVVIFGAAGQYHTCRVCSLLSAYTKL